MHRRHRNLRAALQNVSRRGAAMFALALIVAMAPFATFPLPAAAMGTSVHLLPPTDDGAAVFTNPAGLLSQEQRNLRVDVTSDDGSGASTRSIVYSEPDMGIGAGALTYLASPDLSRYMYTVARRLGWAAGIGVNLKYEANSTGSWWGIDLGYRYALSPAASVGFAVENAVGSQGEGAKGAILPRRPPTLRVGASLSNGQSVFIAGEYYDPDLNSTAIDPAYRIVAGVLLGPATVWGGVETSAGFEGLRNLLGLSLKLDGLRLNLGLRWANEAGQTVTVGLAYHF